jgi:hypothetical protein
MSIDGMMDDQLSNTLLANLNDFQKTTLSETVELNLEDISSNAQRFPSKLTYENMGSIPNSLTI